MIINELENYLPIPEKKLLEKIDYYFTPYNRGLVFNKHMSFEENNTFKSGKPAHLFIPNFC